MEKSHPLKPYADSYAQMSRDGDGRVDCRSVEVDIRQNMIPVTVAASLMRAPVMDAQHFRRMFEVLHNMDFETLATAGIITNHGVASHKDWVRFNDDLTTFVLKLDAERVEKLVALVFERK